MFQFYNFYNIIGWNKSNVVKFVKELVCYHAYLQVWTPVQDEMLLLKREPTNEEQVVGHVPFNLAPSMSNF